MIISKQYESKTTQTIVHLSKTMNNPLLQLCQLALDNANLRWDLNDFESADYSELDDIHPKLGTYVMLGNEKVDDRNYCPTIAIYRIEDPDNIVMHCNTGYRSKIDGTIIMTIDQVNKFLNYVEKHKIERC